mmetsp:Transcript_21729/g.21030  ORF Transcript_21729/g.21030 Transcript_21729/m.21030 type:complete len:265 (+) Transcript_21729:119-913(+)|eukprot:CAMPEP_0119034188 /NCGR_PEP_ID=MMETSP1177-20130426/1211_1 /TAXON_ID=2985 /ORGANISM="Ochromonas sp, Strain CCMP1899" /LENGTH=264 /DNA_ID=CAMNT_0006991463 /DNA_START=111 /DNA_END=905 /DNA_ORIENTATION=+
MSGSKRKSPYRKSVTTTYLDSNITLDEGDYIAKVLGSRGASLFELEISDNESGGLGLLPNKFRNLIWIKKNDFVVVTLTSADMQRYEIKSILNLKHIKYLKTIENWPKKFENFIFGTGVPSAKNDNEDLEHVNADNDNMENYEGIDDDNYEDESSIILDKYGNTIQHNDDNNDDNNDDDNDDDKSNKIVENVDYIDNKNENNIEINNEIEHKVSSVCDDDYEEEEEDDDRHVEYVDDSSDLDLCCINVQDAVIQKTCVLCNIEK